MDSVGEGRGGTIWENGIETCITICEIDHQSRFDAWDQVLRAGALGWPRGMGWGGRWEGDSGCGTHVWVWWMGMGMGYPWVSTMGMVDPCQHMAKPQQYCKVFSLQLK